jgi:hypothetical protein
MGRENYYRKASLWAENCPNFLAARKKTKVFSGNFFLSQTARESFLREIKKKINYRTLCQRALWDLSKGKECKLPHSVPKGPLGLVQGKKENILMEISTDTFS